MYLFFVIFLSLNIFADSLRVKKKIENKAELLIDNNRLKIYKVPSIEGEALNSSEKDLTKKIIFLPVENEKFKIKVEVLGNHKNILSCRDSGKDSNFDFDRFLYFETDRIRILKLTLKVGEESGPLKFDPGYMYIEQGSTLEFSIYNSKLKKFVPSSTLSISTNHWNEGEAVHSVKVIGDKKFIAYRIEIKSCIRKK